MDFGISIVDSGDLCARRRWVALPEPVSMEHLMHLFHMQALALGQHEVNEDSAQGTAGSKEEEDPAEADKACIRTSLQLENCAFHGQHLD